MLPVITSGNNSNPNQDTANHYQQIVTVNFDNYGLKTFLGKLMIKKDKFMFFALNCNKDDSPAENIIPVVLSSGKKLNLLLFKDINETQFKLVLEACIAKASLKKGNKIIKNLKSGCKYLIKMPIRVSSGIIYSLEKVSDGAKKTPDILFSSKCHGNDQSIPQQRKKPSNPATGLLLGTSSALKEVLGALYGVIAEPVKGAKKNGLIGATKGFGKGIVGLVFKPVAGTIDIVTFTARGMGNMSAVIYRNLFKIIRKEKENKGNSNDNNNKAKTETERKENLSGMELFVADPHNDVYIKKNSTLTEVFKKERDNILSGKINVDDVNPEIQKYNKEKLEGVLNNLINNLDPEDYEKNKEFLEDALNFSIILEQEKENQENHQETIASILKLYINKTKDLGELKENLYEFLAIVNENIKPSETPDINILEGDIESKPTSPQQCQTLANHPDLLNNLDDANSQKNTENGNNLMGMNSKGYENRKDNENEIITTKKVIIIEIDKMNEDDENNNMDSNDLLSYHCLTKQTLYVVDDIKADKSKKKDNYSHNINNTIDDAKHWPPKNPNLEIRPVNRENTLDIILPEEALASFKFSEISYEETWKLINEWKMIENHDDIRFPFAYKNGGKIPENNVIMKKVRHLAKEIIMNVGKKILSGNFNLTTVSFPIRAMVPKSHLENIALGTCYFPLYMNVAAKSRDPLQRFKYYIVAAIAYYYLTNSFAKPLNPILGETMHGHYNDGSRVFLEQMSHHPPISYILVHGPNKSYQVYGPSIFAASAGLNSLTLNVKGWRKCIFENPHQEIHNTFPNETYDGTFWGQTTHETLGNMEFVDKENDIYCDLKFGKVKKKPSDYIDGDIKYKGNVVSKISGTYLGWIEINGYRYFDYRSIPPFKFFIERSRLGSDFAYRSDLHYLLMGDIPKAQKEKEALEYLQRNDAKLRKAHMEKTGKKQNHK